MTIPDASLQRVLTSTSDLSNASLATKILITRLRREVGADPASMSGKIKELKDFFQKNTFAHKDLQAI